MRKVLVLLVLAACQREPPAAVAQVAAAAPTPVVVPPPPAPPVAAPVPAAPSPTAASAGKHIDLVSAQPGVAVAPYIVAELARAKTDGRRLLVYVGAKWCEPCQRFHDAAKAGQLDDQFADLRLIEFDLDLDRDRLAADGYKSDLIPLLALPGADGRGNGRGMQGSIKGEGAVANMRPRLLEVLASP